MIDVNNPVLDAAKKQTAAVNTETATPKASESSTMDDTLFNVQTALAESSTRIKGAVARAEEGIKQTQTATDVITNSIQDITSAKQTIQLAKDNAALQAQNNTIEAYKAGGGRDLQIELMTALSDDIRKVNELQAERADILDDEHTGIGIIDNAINLFRGAGTELELKNAIREQNTTSTQIQQITQANESFARVNALTAETLNKGTIAENYKLIGLQGNLDEARAELDTVHSNATAYSNLAAMQQKELTNLIQTYRLEGEAEQREIAKERLAFNREQMAQDREIWKTQLPKARTELEAAELRLKQARALGPTQIAQAEANLAKTQKQMADQERLEESLVLQVQRGQAAAGVPTESRDTILYGLSQSGEIGRKYSRLQEMGSAASPKLGSTPAEAKSGLILASPSGAYKPTKGTKFLQEVTRVQAQKHADPGYTAPRDKEGLATEYNILADQLYAAKAMNIVAGDNSNPFHAPPFTVLEKMSSVANTPLYQKVLKPKKMQETNPQVIMDSAIDAILAGVITTEEAADGVEAIFDQAAANNTELEGGLVRVGLPPQTTYNTQMFVPPSFFEKLKITNPTKPFSSGLLTATGLALSLVDAPTAANYPDSLATVDLMNGVRVREHIVKLLSASKASKPSASTYSNP